MTGMDEWSMAMKSVGRGCPSMEFLWLPALAQALTVALAAWGLARVRALEHLLPDPRLHRLAWFFGLITAAMAVHLVLMTHPWVEAPPWRPVRDRTSALLLTLHHGLLTAAMVVAVRAYGPIQGKEPNAPAETSKAGMLGIPVLGWLLLQAPRPRERFIRPPRPEPGFWAGPFGLIRGLEAGLALYIAVRALVNAWTRRSARSLRVAAAFSLLFVAHAGFWFLHLDGAPRHLIPEAAMVLGIALLVFALPKPPRDI